jgi:hypothetical protein
MSKRRARFVASAGVTGAARFLSTVATRIVSGSDTDRVMECSQIDLHLRLR